MRNLLDPKLLLLAAILAMAAGCTNDRNTVRTPAPPPPPRSN